MKVTYIAEDGTVFNTSDECLAYERNDEELFEAWEQRLMGQEDEDSLWNFLLKINVGSIRFESTSDFWLWRRKFIELAKSFEEMK